MGGNGSSHMTLQFMRGQQTRGCYTSQAKFPANSDPNNVQTGQLAGFSTNELLDIKLTHFCLQSSLRN